MKTERLKAVARAIETETLPDGTPLAFDMTCLLARASRRSGSSEMNASTAYCAGCIAGFAALMFGRPQDRAYLDAQRRVNIVAVDLIAQHALGLSDDEASELFYGTQSGIDIASITASDAAQTLRRASDTGNVRHAAACVLQAAPSPQEGA